MKYQMPLFVLIAATAACNTAAEEPELCSAANTFTYSAAELCIVVEEGFLASACPDDFPNGEEFDDFVICTSANSVPDGAEEEARDRGFGACEVGDTRPDDDGCNTCTCSEEGWACTTMACLDCTPGDTRPAGDGCNTCTCTEDGDWACTLMECLECTPGDTRPAEDGCNTCTCTDDGQGWSCTEMACEPCTPGDTRTQDECTECVCDDGSSWACTTSSECALGVCLETCPGCEDPETADYVGNSPEQCAVIDFGCEEGLDYFNNACGCGCKPPADVAACLEACGVGCPAIEFNVCSLAGENYCSACEAACYGAALAPDREPCECSPPAGNEVALREFVIPESCTVIEPLSRESSVAHSSEEAAGWFNCEVPGSIVVDAGNEVLIRAVFPENPNAFVRGAYRDLTADSYVVYMTAAQYCGGAPPPATVAFFLAPFGDETSYTVETCTHTQCSEFMP